MVDESNFDEEQAPVADPCTIRTRTPTRSDARRDNTSCDRVPHRFAGKGGKLRVHTLLNPFNGILSQTLLLDERLYLASSPRQT